MRHIKQILKRFGPGIITGASDDDPSGIGTYTQAGALFGIRTLWTAPFSFPFMAAIQEISGRIGIVTGQGIASIIKKYYSKKILWACVSLLFVANTINIAADIGAMAQSLQLVIGGNVWVFICLIFLHR
jgi:Mn2+/Fe2+ NRAMP family transporter